MFKLHVYDPTFISGVGRDRGGLFIAVEDGVTTFVSVKPLDVTEETSGQFPVVFVAAKKWKSGHLIVEIKTGSFSSPDPVTT